MRARETACGEHVQTLLKCHLFKRFSVPKPTLCGLTVGAARSTIPIVTRVEPERSDKTKEVAECFHRVSRAAMIAPA